LEGAVKTSRPGEQRTQVVNAYVTAARQIATQALKNSNFLRAHKVLTRVATSVEGAVTGEARIGLNCDMALAATGAGIRRSALKLLRVMEKEKTRCPFVAPANELAVQILIAWNEGATARTANKALRRLGTLRRRAEGGPAGALVRTAARDIAIRAAIDAYSNGSASKARRFLQTARKYDPQSPEIEHNLAVLELATGKPDRAIRLLNRATGIPEALVNLGIAHDLKNQPKKALNYYRRGLEAGARAPQLKNWISSKERLWGAGEE
ncbi:MAG: tetratricopeptide repeat protein, partial [Myxococcota bacterium]